MAVTWPDGSVTGSVRVETPAPVPAEPEPEKESEPVLPVKEKGVGHGDR